MFDLFSDFSDFFNNFDVFPVYQDVKTCPHCGRSYADFQKTGKFGCAQCYETFRAPVAATLKQIHQNTTHTGKLPSRSAEGLKQQRRMAELKQQLSSGAGNQRLHSRRQLHAGAGIPATGFFLDDRGR